jgi:hypothetical protein
MRGGARPGAGRPKGSASTKDIQPVIGVLRAGGRGPRFKNALEFAMATINDSTAEMGDKIKLAIAAMPYQHPKLAEEPAAGKKHEAAAAAERAGSGRYATPATPLKLVRGAKP